MNLESCEYKEFRFKNKRIVLNIQKNKLFEVDDFSSRILSSLKKGSNGRNDSLNELEKDSFPKDVENALAELKELGLVGEKKDILIPIPKPKLPKITALCLHVIHACNLQCSYCYAQGGIYNTPNKKMELPTAVNAVEFLFEQIPFGESGSISFFGGEPIMNWELLEKIIPYIRLRESEVGKIITLSVTTNGTLLTNKIINFFHKYRVKIQISLDGPAHIHDKMRVYPNGKGTYNSIISKIKKVLEVQGRCSLRASLSTEEPKLKEVVEHLLDIGATFVHAERTSEPLRGGIGLYQLSTKALRNIKKDYQELKKKYLVKIQKESKLLPIFAFIRILRLLEGTGKLKLFGCGMGRLYLAVSPSGELYPCHRFVDEREYMLGNINKGLLKSSRNIFLDLHVDRRNNCKECWARYLCGGGCYNETIAYNNTTKQPDPAFCDISKHIITQAIEIGTYLSQIPKEELREMEKRLNETNSYC